MKIIENKTNTKTNTRVSIGIMVPLVIGASLIFAGSLAANSYSEVKQRESLEAEAAHLSKAMMVQSGQQSDLDVRLKETQSRLDRAINYFPAELTGNAVLQSILMVASVNGTQVLNVQEKPRTKKIVGDSVYYACPFSLKLEGSLESLLAMIAALEQQEAGPVVVQRVAMNSTKTAYNASLELTFYTRSLTESVPTPEKSAKR